VAWFGSQLLFFWYLFCSRHSWLTKILGRAMEAISFQHLSLILLLLF